MTWCSRLQLRFRRLLLLFLVLYVSLILVFHSLSVLAGLGGGEEEEDLSREEVAAMQQVATPTPPPPPHHTRHRPHGPECSHDDHIAPFTRLSPEVIIYSAFYDDRDAVPYIRFMAILQKGIKKRKDVSLSCHTHPSHAPSPVRLYEMCENHNKRFGGYILSCEVTRSYMESERPCQVALTLQTSAGNRSRALALAYPTWEEQRHTISTCVPPLHSHLNPEKLVQFVEMSRVLGAQHFTFYLHDEQFEASGSSSSSSSSSTPAALVLEHILHYYHTQGLATVRRWPLPVHSNEIWYFGQSVAIGDCLYRNMGHTKYLTFNDLDEFIVPQGEGRTWADLLATLWPPGKEEADRIAGYRVQSAFFTPRQPAAKVEILENTERSKKLSKVRTKTIVRPQLIFELGIHHISRPLDGYDSALADAATAILYHYRKCIADFGMNCVLRERDETMLRYREEFLRGYNATVPRIDEFIQYGGSAR